MTILFFMFPIYYIIEECEIQAEINGWFYQLTLKQVFKNEPEFTFHSKCQEDGWNKKKKKNKSQQPSSKKKSFRFRFFKGNFTSGLTFPFCNSYCLLGNRFITLSFEMLQFTQNLCNIITVWQKTQRRESFLFKHLLLEK